MASYKTRSDAEIIREAEALRSETIRNFFVGMFEKRDQLRDNQPINAVPAK